MKDFPSAFQIKDPRVSVTSMRMLCSALLLFFGLSCEIELALCQLGSGGGEQSHEVTLVPETSRGPVVQNFTTAATSVGGTKCSDGFLCRNRTCISSSLFCNGRNDCNDGSDEIPADGKITNTSEIACRQYFDGPLDFAPKLCILPHSQESKRQQICKISTNCSDGFLCRNQRCIISFWFCDGNDNCNDGSDEIRADRKIANTSGIACRQYFDESRDFSPKLCVLPQSQASKSQLFCKIRNSCSDGFLCRNQRCILSYFFCDGPDNCKDGSDEIRADGNTMNTSGIACRQHFDKSWDTSPKLCILPQSQESKSQQICKIKTDCSEGFTCGNGLCAGPNEVCGGDGRCGYDDDWSLELSNRGDRYCSVIYSSLTCLPPQKHICDATSYCEGGVDECLCGNGDSQVFLDEKCFRCLRNRTTVIPLGQLCDGIFDCFDLTDECLCNDGERPLLCDAVEWEEQSVDPLMINCTGNITTLGMNQICDRINDCENKIDEENCTRDSNLGTNPSKISDVSTYFCEYLNKNVTACDGIPECYEMLYEEECSLCSNRSQYCKHLVWGGKYWYLRCPSGDGYPAYYICDGKSLCQSNVDEFSCANWFYCKNETDGFERFTWDKVCDTVEDCLDGSDEGTYQNCSYFICEDGSNVKYLDNRQVCDGTPDCVEGSDECQDHCIKSVFSDIESMIKNEGVVGFVWIISIAAVAGNIAVIVLTTCVLIKERNDSRVEKSAVINKTLILNLSVSDLIVGIYTLAIVIKNSLSERYCLIDQEWRSSSTCSAIGSLLVIGSQQSVFTMIIITVFRTLGITSRHKFDPSYKKFGLVVVVTWVASVFCAVIPLMTQLEDHFIDSVWYRDNKLFSTINKTRVENLTNWLTLLHEDTNKTDIASNIGSWATLDILINELHPNLTVQRKFGFYSTHAVCLPTFFPNRKTDTAWWYSVLIISINFVSFVAVFVGSVIIYRSATAPSMALGEDVRQKRAARMQAKLSRIVITDFCCWIPVCVMGFIQLSGIDIPHDAYIPIALIVIPINSSLNPFLYSNVPDKLWEKIKSFFALQCRRPFAPGAQENRDNVLKDNVTEMRNLQKESAK